MSAHKEYPKYGGLEKNFNAKKQAEANLSLASHATAEVTKLRKALEVADKVLEDIADDGEFDVDPSHDWDTANDHNRHVRNAQQARTEIQNILKQ